MEDTIAHNRSNSDEGDDEGDGPNADNEITGSTANIKGKNRGCHAIYTPNIMIVSIEIMTICKVAESKGIQGDLNFDIDLYLFT